MTDKSTTELTIPELSKAIPKMTDEELKAAYVAEKAAGPDKERKGAVSALETEANERELILTEEAPLVDGELAKEVPGAQPASPHDPDEARDAHAAALARAKEELGLQSVEDRLKALEDREVPSGDEFDARKEVLKLHRAIAALANHLNFPLPS